MRNSYPEKIKVGDLSLSIQQWADVFGINKKTLYEELKNYGCPDAIERRRYRRAVTPAAKRRATRMLQWFLCRWRPEQVSA